MGKADMERDYYGDLELPPNSSELEIKKQFKKLALKYHPDRNPGREAEVNSKFQNINSAHEILTDPEQRRKYDAGRTLGGRTTRSTGFASGSGTTSSGMKGNPWSNAGSEWAPPPKPPPVRKQAPTSAGASRWANSFSSSKTSAPKPTRATPSAAEERKNNYQAWESMRNKPQQPKAAGGQNQKPKDPSSEQKNYGAREGATSQKNPYPAPPRPDFNADGDNIRRTPSRKNGYMPSTSGGDEPAAASFSSYYTSSNRPELPPRGPAPPPPPPDSTRPAKSVPGSSTDEDRSRTPYSTNGGERTNPLDGSSFGRSTNFRDGATASDTGADPDLASPSKRTHRSYTPQKSKAEERYTPQPFANDSSSSDDNTEQTFRPPQSRPTATARRRVPLKTDQGSQSPQFLFSKDAYPRDANGNIYTGRVPGAAGSRDANSQYDYPCSQDSLTSPTSDEKLASISIPGFNLPFLNTFQELSTPSSFSANSSKFSGLVAPDIKITQAIPPRIDPDFPGSLNAFETQQFELLKSLINGPLLTAGSGLLKPPSGNALKEYPLENFAMKNRRSTIGTSFNFQGHAPSLSSLAFHESLWNAENIKTSSPWRSPLTTSVSHLDPESLERRFANLSNSGPYAGADDVFDSFSSDADGSTSSGHQQNAFASSAENISTTFSPENWHGKFQAGDYFGADNVESNRSGRPRSPVKRKPYNAPSLNTNDHHEPSSTSQAPSTTTASPGAARFAPEEWAPFKAQAFAPNGFTSPGGSSRSRPPRRTKTGSSIKVPFGTGTKTEGTAAMVDDSSEDDIHLYAAQPNAEHVKPTSPMPMDVDPPAPRNVEVEPLRADWRAGDTAGANSTAAKPPIPPRSPQPTGATSNFVAEPENNDDEDFKTNFEELKDVEPLHMPATGLNSFSDLTSSLPFTSAASARVPISRSTTSKQLDLPHPPKAPMLPSIPSGSVRPSPSSWDSYLVTFKAYMAEWYNFNTKMILHFVERKNQIDSMPDSWLEAFGDSNVDKYMVGLTEDQIVREWWITASGKHENAFVDFQWMRGVMKEGKDKALPKRGTDRETE